MQKPTVFFNDYVSIAVMLLMAMALIAGQADAGIDRAVGPNGGTALDYPIVEFDAADYLELSGLITEKAISVSIDVVKELGPFRGEDE